jgi:hypothetical protein
MSVELSDTGAPSDLSAMRWHELGLQRWLNDNFQVAAGYPVPVVYTAPMDAFSHFKELWAQDNNPFTYLLGIKDKNGTPLYEPHPSPPRYPIFSVHRKGWRMRTNQNYSIHNWRHLGWPTIPTSGTITRQDLSHIMVARMPMAWDFLYQLDFFCLRPDTLAAFIKHFMWKLRRTGGLQPQTWVTIAYPFYGLMFARLGLDGDIQSMMPDTPDNEANVEYHVSMNLVMEGWEVDLDIQEVPALWTLVGQARMEVSPGVLETVYTKAANLRTTRNTNPVMAGRANLPPFGP